MTEINSLISKYYTWLQEETKWRAFDEHIEITAPYLDRNNDYIQIYLQEIEKGYILTDDGATIEGLEMEGCSLDTGKRNNLMKSTLAGHGVDREDNSLVVSATEENFPLKKHSLIQSILAINDIFYLAQPHTSESSISPKSFSNNVENWFETLQIHYERKTGLPGRSGYERKFDFVILESDSAPKKFVSTVANPTRDAADSLIIKWMDTSENREKEAKAYAVINDDESGSESKFLDALNALKNYEIGTIPWTQRDSHGGDLAA